MRVRSLDLHETFRTDGLVAAASLVQVRRVVEETYGTLRRLTIEVCLNWQTGHIRVMRKAQFGWCGVLSRGR
jgi:hypothetical protein